MSRILLVGGLLAALAGCTGQAAESDPPVGDVALDEAAALHEAGALFLDVNNDDFRAKHGVVPGAVLLASSARYDVAATLPSKKDADLVFYCTSRL